MVSLPGFEISERLEAPSVQFRTDGHIVAVTNCHELLLPFTLDGEQLSLGQLEVPITEPDCTQRERRIDAALAAVLLSADALVGGLPSDRLTISGPLGEVILAQPAAQTEQAAESADAGGASVIARRRRWPGGAGRRARRRSPGRRDRRAGDRWRCGGTRTRPEDGHAPVGPPARRRTRGNGGVG